MLDENGTMTGRWELGGERLSVGRGASADVIVDDPALSRQHFLIERAGQDYMLRDLNSQNGTWVDGQRAGIAKLHHHDCILAGRTIFLFKERAENTVAVPR
ncbi:MAG TPA: FHA domain-containing protein [Verrucomicrobiae bacterium]